MVIGPDFIWLHFPKCAGSSIEQALRQLFPTAQFDPLDPSHVIWHDTIPRRASRDPTFAIDGRRIISGFRRLPYWLLSRVHFEASRGPHHHTVTREMLLRGAFYEHNGILQTADDYASRFNQPAVATWIRTEFLREDMALAFRRDISAALEHKNQTKFVRSLAFWFTDEELAGLYAANPYWAALELRLYGNVLSSPSESVRS